MIDDELDSVFQRVDSQSLRFDWMWFCSALSTWCCSFRTTSASPSRGRAAGSGSCVDSEFLSACFGVFTLLFGATWKRPTESLGLTVKFRPLILTVVTLTIFHASLAEELTRSKHCFFFTKLPTFLPFLRTMQVVRTSWSISPVHHLLNCVSCSVPHGLHFLVCTSRSVLSGLQRLGCVLILWSAY